MTEFLSYLKDAVHTGRIIYMIVVPVVFWFIWHSWRWTILWFGVCAGIILADAVYEYVQVRVRKRVIQRRNGSHA
jgi:hypothetical protein